MATDGDEEGAMGQEGDAMEREDGGLPPASRALSPAPPVAPVVADAGAQAAPRPAAKAGLLAHGLSQEPQQKKAKDGGGGGGGGGGSSGGGSAADAETSTCMTAAERVAARAAASKSAAQLKTAAKEKNRTWKAYMFFQGSGTDRSASKGNAHRAWLRITPDGKGAQCAWCIAAGVGTQGFCEPSGCMTGKDHSLRSHEGSELHKQAARCHQLLEAAIADTTVADTVAAGFTRQEALFEREITNKITTAYFLAKNNIALTKMEPLVQLCESAGGQMGGQTYVN